MKIFLFMLVITSQPVFAEMLGDLRARFAGAEVEIKGHIGSHLYMGDDETIGFRDEDGNAYPVIFDAGREARKKVEDCKFAMFTGGNPCAITGKAEIELNGSQIRLSIFELTSIEPPAPEN